MSSLTSLAEQLLAQAKQFDALLETTGLECPSFRHDTLDLLPDEGQHLRRKLADTSHTLQQLTRGARLSGLDIAFSWIDQLILRIIWQYNLASAVPLEGFATYDQISRSSGLDRSLVVRTIRAAIPLNIFDEPRPNEVCHTAISRLIAVDEGYRSAIGLQVKDIGPASTKLIEVWDSLGGDAGGPDQSAFSLLNSGRSLFAAMSEEPQMARRFNLALEYSLKEKQTDSLDITHAFDWHSLDYPDSYLIDLGGGYGYVSQTLVKHTQNLAFVVQDLPHVIEEGQRRLSPDVRGRVSFQAWDFLQAQSAERPPCAFLISRCLHNWSDDYCVTILRSLIPALRQGSRVLIWDVVLSDEPVRRMSERFSLQQDLIMATVSNGKDRSLTDFRQILNLSDKRFRFAGIRQKDGGQLGMIEVSWAAHL